MKGSLLSLVAFAAVPSFVSARPLFANVLQRAAQAKDEYDYIIVGGGTAGLTVADRLTADGKCMKSRSRQSGDTFLGNS